MKNQAGMNPITEDDIANYLGNNPDFFERHAQVLATVQMTSPHGNRAVSLQERQAEMLREKIKALEHRIMEIVRNSSENSITTERLHRWAESLLLTSRAADLPECITSEMRERFHVPQAVVKVWSVDDAYAASPFAQGVSEDAKSFAASLTNPFCGANMGFEAASWLPDPAAAASVAFLPLREGDIRAAGPAFGMLVLASPDATRFESGMGTEFLERIAELASAALTRLR